jgi:peptidoglycan/LPS O-acetylase OafA/YrhL
MRPGPFGIAWRCCRWHTEDLMPGTGDAMATETTLKGSTVAVPRAHPSFYRPELDALRFFGFFAIYLFDSLSHDPNDYARYHLPRLASNLMATIATSGRFGITLLFLLSGYLITSLLLRERWVNGRVSVRSFYIRRILRIWPLYFFVLLVAVAWPWAGRLPIPYFVAYLFLVGNWMTALLGPPPSWVRLLWSVSLMQQFFLFWPVVIKQLSRNGRFYLALGLVVFANITRYYLAVGSLHPYSVFSNTFAELDSIAVGALCAIALKGSVPVLPPAKRLLLVYVGFILLLGCGYFGKTDSPMFVIAGYPCAVAGCLALFVAVCGLSFTWQPLIYLGRISYGLYVYHLLALILVGRALGGKAGTPVRFLTYWFGSLILTIVLASVSYRWLESPFLRLKERYTVVRSHAL